MAITGPPGGGSSSDPGVAGDVGPGGGVRPDRDGRRGAVWPPRHGADDQQVRVGGQIDGIATAGVAPGRCHRGPARVPDGDVGRDRPGRARVIGPLHRARRTGADVPVGARAGRRNDRGRRPRTRAGGPGTRRRRRRPGRRRCWCRAGRPAGCPGEVARAGRRQQADRNGRGDGQRPPHGSMVPPRAEGVGTAETAALLLATSGPSAGSSRIGPRHGRVAAPLASAHVRGVPYSACGITHSFAGARAGGRPQRL